jgi:benzoyl-CoA 2,3-dioxygenase component A
METGVMDAFQALCDEAGLNWPQCHEKMVSEGRFHVETY